MALNSLYVYIVKGCKFTKKTTYFSLLSSRSFIYLQMNTISFIIFSLQKRYFQSDLDRCCMKWNLLKNISHGKSFTTKKKNNLIPFLCLSKLYSKPYILWTKVETLHRFRLNRDAKGKEF